MTDGMRPGLHAPPPTGIAQLMEKFVTDLDRAGLSAADVMTAAGILKRLLARVRVGTRARPSSNGHHAPAEGN